MPPINSSSASRRDPSDVRCERQSLGTGKYGLKEGASRADDRTFPVKNFQAIDALSLDFLSDQNRGITPLLTRTLTVNSCSVRAEEFGAACLQWDEDNACVEVRVLRPGARVLSYGWSPVYRRLAARAVLWVFRL